MSETTQEDQPTRRSNEAGEGLCERFPRSLPIPSHAEAVLDWLRRSDSVGRWDAQSISWDLVESWLALAAGLLEVQLDLSTRGSYLCSGAAPYEDAASATASALHTELTRLLYVYSAVEIAVRTMTPSLGERDAILPCARKILSACQAGTPLHYDCGIRHLKVHVNGDPWLASNGDLLKQFGPSDTPGPAIGMQVGSKFRHLMVHGLIAAPEPIRRGDSWVSGAQAELCVIRHASGALLHSLQMLFWRALGLGSLSYSDDCEVDEGLWTELASGGGTWKHVFTPAERVLTLHLRPDDGPEG